MWTQGGFSGTDAAVLEIGRALVASGQVEVTALGWCNQESYTDPDTGINFIDTLEPENVNYFDWYCPLLVDWFDHAHPFLHAIRDRRATKLLVWIHCTLRDNGVLHDWRREFEVFGMAVSQWVFDLYAPHFEPGRLWLVPNGVAPRFFEVKLGGEGGASIMHGGGDDFQKDRGSWCFHACFGRGGAVALRAFREVRLRKPEAAQVFHGMSYISTDRMEEEGALVHWHGSMTKTQLAAMFARTEYFVYPLGTPDGDVHHDTFACCILEAMAMGVIVVTWAVACIPSLYGDLVVALPPPRGYPANNRLGPREPWFCSDEAVHQVAAAVLALDADPARKADLRRRGMEWARKQTWQIGADAMMRGMEEYAATPHHLTWSTIPLLCINLDRSTERLAAVTAELARLGRKLGVANDKSSSISSSSACRMPAVELPDRRLACSLSHLRCVDIAIERGWPAVAILEDDFCCLDPDAFLRDTEAFLRSEAPWDVFMLGTDPFSMDAARPEFGPGIRRVLCSYGAEAYIVRAAYLPVLRANIAAGIDLIRKTSVPTMDHSVDVYWHRLQARDAWYVAYPMTALQRSGMSDINEVFVDAQTFRSNRHVYPTAKV